MPTIRQIWGPAHDQSLDYLAPRHHELTAPAPMLSEEFDASALARDMIEVHGAEAATIARDNARNAAIAAQLPQAKGWIRVLDLIQRQYAETTTPLPAMHT